MAEGHLPRDLPDWVQEDAVAQYNEMYELARKHGKRLDGFWKTL